jgi:hypothetical protein
MHVSLCKINSSIQAIKISIELTISPLNLVYTYAHGVI